LGRPDKPFGNGPIVRFDRQVGPPLRIRRAYP